MNRRRSIEHSLLAYGIKNPLFGGDFLVGRHSVSQLPSI